MSFLFNVFPPIHLGLKPGSSMNEFPLQGLGRSDQPLLTLLGVSPPFASAGFSLPPPPYSVSSSLPVAALLG